MHVIKNVLAGSVGQEMGIVSGDILLRIDGKDIKDFIDYSYFTAADIFVLDLNGRILKTYKYSLDQKQLIIDVSGFAKGIYSIKVNSSNFNTVKKIVVN